MSVRESDYRPGGFRVSLRGVCEHLWIWCWARFGADRASPGVLSRIDGLSVGGSCHGSWHDLWRGRRGRRGFAFGLSNGGCGMTLR